MDAMLVFPHQLYINRRDQTALFFIEDARFFVSEMPFHKHKIMLHKASMKAHYDTLSCDKFYHSYPINLDKLKVALKNFDRILAFDPVDHVIKKQYADVVDVWLESLNFMTDISTIESFFSAKKRYLMHDFYIFQRKRLNILMDGKNPVGNQYSFDEDNRKPLPKDMYVPKPLVFEHDAYVLEAALWTDRHFSDNPGTTQTFNHPVTRKDAHRQLHAFMDHKFMYFGPYQDAMSHHDPYLFHSNLSSSLNIGLLSSYEIVEAALNKDVPISSKEGFIRQIIGWREFIRAVYHLKGEDMRQSNVLNHQNRLSDVWFHAKTEIPVLDQTIQKLIDHAYAHHIERLMVLGNIMLLVNIHPDDVYNYFMAMHIDAYDWVMVPNIYGMSQFSTGPLMTTKPYFSGANYLKKMGIADGPWSEVWDALFYLFLKDHREVIQKNPRLSVLTRNLDHKDAPTLHHYTLLKHALIKRLTRTLQE